MKVLLVGNYLLDGQESMMRFCRLMSELLIERGHEVHIVRPQMILGNQSQGGFKRWTGYLDKYVLFLPELAKQIAWADVVHICDHSNAVYVPYLGTKPHVVTCHDLLAVRAGLGEETYCPISPLGKYLQRWIFSGLRKAKMICCDSRATAADAERLLIRNHGSLPVIQLGLNYPYKEISAEERSRRLSSFAELRISQPYLVHVGSNQPRKNCDGILRIFAQIKDRFPGQLVFAGQELPSELKQLARDLHVSDRVVEIVKPDETTLEALYGGAFALLFPSKTEGFGWPIIEAQACGCPVLSSNSGPLPEAVGNGGIMHDFADENAFVQSILELMGDEAKRNNLIQAGLANVKGFSNATMVASYIDVYKQVLKN